MSDGQRRLAAALQDRYAIERELGAGGMATVYLAQDLKHDRQVAIKVLRPELAAVLGADRFVQEIKTTASLQHPHILPLHDSGEADGFLYYVMPYVEGETLRDKLNREKQLGIDEAVRITTEVADALDYAHGQGVIHRDIKPENILLHNGRPIVADFGIALAVSAAAGGRMTETGLSLGTPHYMSPEQATAEKDLTHRSDIYSLGAVLYEMLTGDPPHTGSSAQQVISKIVTEEAAPVAAVRRTVPRNVAAAAATCLEKLPADRFASATAFAGALADPRYAGSSGTEVIGSSAVPPFRRAAVVIPVISVLAALAAWGWLRPTSRGAPPAMSVQLALPEGHEVRSEPGAILALAPDGSKLAVLGRTPNTTSNVILIRPLDATEAYAVPGSDGARDPAWSPSGDSLAFSVGTELRVASVLPGGRTSTLPASPVREFGFGISWSEHGEIAFVARDGIAVFNVADRTERIFPFGTSLVRWPHWVPDRRLLIYTSLSDWTSGTGTVGLLDARTGEAVDSLTRGFNGRVSTSGHLVWADREGVLWAAPIDIQARRLVGPPTAMMSGLLVAPGREARFTIARSGGLAYVRNVTRTDLRLVVASARTGERQQIRVPNDLWLSSDLDLSPDGGRVAYSAVQHTSHDVWLTDLATGRTERFSSQWSASHHPVWTPDGERLAYYSDNAVFWRPVDRSSAVERLSERSLSDPTSWSSDGRMLLGGEGDIWTLTPPDTVPVVLTRTDARERTPALSPDGRWLAFASDQSGSYEIWVRAFEGAAGPWKVSDGGGITPIWSPEGDRLYFRTREAVMVAEVRPGATFRWGTPVIVIASDYPELGNSSWEKSFDVFPDGDRVLLYERVGSEGWRVTYETRWVQRTLEGLR